MIEKQEQLDDRNCYTLPNGDCVGGPCMHNPNGPPPGMTIAKLLARALQAETCLAMARDVLRCHDLPREDRGVVLSSQALDEVMHRLDEILDDVHPVARRFDLLRKLRADLWCMHLDQTEISQSAESQSPRPEDSTCGLEWEYKIDTLEPHDCPAGSTTAITSHQGSERADADTDRVTKLHAILRQIDTAYVKRVLDNSGWDPSGWGAPDNPHRRYPQFDRCVITLLYQALELVPSKLKGEST